MTKRVKEQNQLVSVGLCLQRGLLHWPRLCCWEGRSRDAGLPADLSQTVHGFPEQPRCQRCRAVTASQSLEEEGRGHSKGEEKAGSWKGGKLPAH